MHLFGWGFSRLVDMAKHQGKYHSLYSTALWQSIRAQQLTDHPLCWYHEQTGKVVAADTVDHITPHKGNTELFHDPNNLRSLCTKCHNSLAAIKDRVGYAPGSKENGMPVDFNHPFYRGGR